ncbi:MAG: triose-phosphate isomerase [bacterium]
MPELDVKELVELVARQVLERLGHPSAQPGAPGGDTRNPLIAANWKMNASKDELPAYVAELAATGPGVDVLVLPPSVLLPGVRAELARAGRPDIAVGAQDLHWEAQGAHTGELSGSLLREVGARWTLVGHSERRAAGETDDQVRRKLHAGLDAGLAVMLCVGELAQERRTGATFRVLRSQLLAALGDTALQPPDPPRLAVAYEPVWAIGTGLVATLEQIQEAAAFVRRVIAELYDWNRARRIRVLYGGSVNASNAAEVMSAPDVNGLLVGGASLSGRSFREIVEAAPPGPHSEVGR